MPSKPSRRVTVEPATPGQLSDFTGHLVGFPVFVRAAWLHRRRGKPKLIAFGGLAWRRTHRDTDRTWCEIWLDVVDPRCVPALTLVRWARRMLRSAEQLGEPIVFCVRGGDDPPKSRKLLELVGMSIDPTLHIYADDGTVEPGDIFTWRPSLPSEQPSP